MKKTTNKKTNKATNKQRKATTTKAVIKKTNLYKEQNQHRAEITQQQKADNISSIIRAYFKDNYISTISYKECYDCGNGSYNYRAFIKSDKKLPKQFINSKEQNDIKTMVLVNTKSKKVKCAITCDNPYQAF